MRRSPLRHPVAILRTTIGLTQKELADLAGRAARTIQAVELGTLPLSEDLALVLAEATGVDAGWLLEGDPETPPRKGVTARHECSMEGAYTMADYEQHRAFMEAPVASAEEAEADMAQAMKTLGPKDDRAAISIPTVKRVLLTAKKKFHQEADRQTVAALERLLENTILGRSGDLVRWKVRRFLLALAEESGVDLNWPPSRIVPFTHVHLPDPAPPSAPPQAMKPGRTARGQKA